MWGVENSRVVLENERGNPKVEVWCALMHNKVIGPFISSECNISAVLYLDTIELYAAPQNSFSHGHFSNRMVHHHTGVTCSSFLGCSVSEPMDWEGRSNTMATTFTGHYKVYSTPVPYVDTLKARIRDAVATVTEEMLRKRGEKSSVD
jgi:hypothetical protein